MLGSPRPVWRGRSGEELTLPCLCSQFSAVARTTHTCVLMRARTYTPSMRFLRTYSTITQYVFLGIATMASSFVTAVNAKTPSTGDVEVTITTTSTVKFYDSYLVSAFICFSTPAFVRFFLSAFTSSAFCPPPSAVF